LTELHRYSFFGTVLRTPLALDVLPAPPPADIAADQVTLTLDDVPQELPNVVWSSPFLSVGPDHRVLVDVAAVGRFLVSDGREIRFSPASDATPAAVQSILLSIVAGAVLHQRGAFPLHASCVEMDGSAIAIAGPAARGKSTLAAALVARGARLISDDISVVQTGTDAPCVVQGALGMRLWPDAIDSAGVAPCGEWTPVRPGHAKHVHAANLSWMAPAPLRAILRLEVENAISPPGWRLLHGPASAAPMQNFIYRINLSRHLGRFESLCLNLMGLADHVPIIELRRPNDLGALETTVSMARDAIANVRPMR
jgi:hypothetical protein